MGAPWRQLPAAYGKWNSVYRRWASGCDRGVGPRRLAYRQADPDLSAVLFDSPVVRAHIRAAGAPKKKVADPALGRGQGGVGTQIHRLTDRRGRPLGLRVPDGPRHDRTQARVLGEERIDARPACLIADRAYDGDAFRAWLARKGIEAVIPARHRRTNPQPRDPARYPAHHAAARSLGWFKGWRRVATHYDHYAHRCLGFLCLAATWIWLKP